MDFVKEYWPALLGTVVVIIAAIWLWPEEEIQSAPEPGMLGMSDLDAPNAANGEGVDSDVQLARSKSEGVERAVESERSFELREHVVAVPVEVPVAPVSPPSEDETKSALAQVEVVLYQTQECVHCRRAREYFDHNKVRYSARDVNSDERIKLKAKQLSGGTAVPVITIDGKVLRGFSEGSVQAALTEAVERRVLSSR